MKRVLVFISVITIAFGLTWALKAQQIQREPEATLRLTRPELESLYQIIDDAAVPGHVRKPLLQKIQDAYTIAFAPKPEVKKDTTKPKKN